MTCALVELVWQLLAAKILSAITNGFGLGVDVTVGARVEVGVSDGIGVEARVGIEVAVAVGVLVAVLVGVLVGALVAVAVGVGAEVGPTRCAWPQAEVGKLSAKMAIAMICCFAFTSLLRCYGRAPRLLKPPHLRCRLFLVAVSPIHHTLERLPSMRPLL